MKKIGIILVNFNGCKDTLECIESIKCSDYKNYEIIVVDNASKEELEELSNCKDIIFHRLEANVGFGVANNIGADIAIDNNCDLLLCLNNDTVIEKDTLTYLAENTDEKTITTGAIYYYSQKDELWYGGGEVSKLKGNFRHKYYMTTRDVSFISGCCMMLAAECYKKIGLFDPAYFMYYEDSDFSLKAMINGYKLKYIFEAKIYHKVGRSIKKTVGLKDYYLTRNRLYILHKYKDYFYKISIIYFYISRWIYIFIQIVKRNSIKPFIDGIHDFHKGVIGVKRD